MFHSPSDRRAGLLLRARANRKALNFLSPEPVNLVNRPGHLQMKASLQQIVAPRRAAKTFQQCFLARIDENEAGRQNQDDKLNQDQPCERLLKETIKPCFRNLESKLIIERLGGRAE